MKANILVVDDMADNVQLLMEILADQGYKTRPALNGSHALATSLAEPPDLILLDIIMPGIDGYGVCKALKSNEITCDIPIIFISALHESIDKDKAFSLGGVDYITKPFQPEEVIARVHTHLSLRNLQKDLQQEIARRTSSEERLRDLNQQLTEANSSKNTFFSIIAHDLRGPLGTFRELSEQIVEHIEEYQKDDLLRIIRAQRDAARNLFALLENLLIWAKSQQCLLEYHPQPIDIRMVVAHNIALLTPQAEQKQVELQNLVDEKIFIHADYHMLNTIVRNLLSNALKFTPSSGSVTVSAGQNGMHTEVSITDTGIGIPAHNLSKLFRIDVKYQRRGTANETGTGLGLVLCKEFVEHHGGRIWIDSDAGQGATVKFTLPTLASE